MSTPAEPKVTPRARVEAMRNRERAGRRRKLAALGIGVGAAAVVAALAIAGTVSGGSKAAPITAGSAPSGVLTALTSVPPAVIDTVGAGTGTTGPKPLTGQPALTAGGLPQVVYVGAEYCPYCAAERWAVVQALSRFGTFTGLGQTHSSSTDVYPSTATLDFHGATYSSPYLAFSGYEEQAAQGVPLDAPPADIATLHETVGQGGYPFVDLGGKSYISGADYDPALLKGLTQDQIAAALSNSSSPVAIAVIGVANRITASLCTLTGNAPAAVCSASGVTAAAKAGGS